MELEHALEKFFGFTQFRGQQKAIVENIIAGRDVLTLMSTGGGKSLCYQLPAVLLPGLTVVISPLISLMEDQVAHLVKQNILATWITHLLPPDESSYRLELITINHYQLVYVSPERLQDATFCSMLQTIPISLVVVDEAHCISEWGHEFRPEYRQIQVFLDRFTARPRVAAFTATATLEVAQDIVHQLSLHKPAIFHTSVQRTNLGLHVIPVYKQQEKWLHLLRILANHQHENGIIYTSTRDGAWGMATRLQALAQHVPCFHWLSVGYYHAGLSDISRRNAQKHFQSGKYNVLCATTAFGMGIDKGDIRYVIHLDHPNCLESYYQQVGRAGRDGVPSSAYLLFHPNDQLVHQQMIQQQTDTANKRRNLERLHHMVQFCQSPRCRMQKITAYFEENTAQCQMCDWCTQQTNQHPFFQSPLSSKELDTIQLLRQSKYWEHGLGSSLTDFQLLTAVALQPNNSQWQFVPGCGRGWRNTYERYNRT